MYYIARKTAFNLRFFLTFDFITNDLFETKALRFDKSSPNPVQNHQNMPFHN